MKLILADPQLFAEFIRDFIPIEILKNIKPTNIEDVSTRLLSLVSEQKDGDTIKRINLDDGKSLFIITIIEHESKVNFRAPFKMLLYIALILNDYEKEVNKNTNITFSKDYKYPPILPIIFYDGESEWTAETNFLNRTEMNDIFEKYIPKFEYELVSLKDYSFDDLAEYGDILSLFMMMDKVKTAEALGELSDRVKEYGKRLKDMNVPPHLMKLLVSVITVLLNKIEVPHGEINALVERIDERGVNEIMSIEDYSVPQVREQARAEARAEIRAEVERQKAEAEKQRAETERRLKSAIKALLDNGSTITEVADIMNVAEHDITDLLPELA